MDLGQHQGRETMQYAAFCLFAFQIKRIILILRQVQGSQRPTKDFPVANAGFRLLHALFVEIYKGQTMNAAATENHLKVLFDRCTAVDGVEKLCVFKRVHTFIT